MKGLKVFSVFIMSLCCLSVFAAPKTITKEQSDKLAVDYVKAKYLQTLVSSQKSLTTPTPPPQCYPDSGGSCVQTLCSKQDCSWQSTFDRIAAVCRGSDGGCVETLCSKQDCSWQSTGERVANACKGANGDCVKTGCSKQDCNWQSTGERIAKTCQSVRDGGCVVYGCQQQDCSWQSTFERIVQSCSGY